MKKVDFLFIYEVRNRELENIALLASELKRRGYSVAFLNSWACLNLKYQSYDADVLVLSACYNTGTYQFFTGHAAKFRKVVNLQWEQVVKNGYIISDEVTSWHFSGDGLVTRHVCWGDNTKRRLRERFGISEDFLRVCGYLPLDFYRPVFKEFIIPREELFAQNGLDKDKTTALFISSFALIGMPENLTGVASVDLKAMDLRSAHESQSAMLEWFCKALPDHPEIQFIYRFHPVEENNPILAQMQKDFSNFYCISKHAIKHWINASDKIYNWVSTSAIEVYLCNKQTFVLRPTALPWECDMPIFENCQKIETFDSFDETLSLSLDVPSQPMDEKLLQDYYFIDSRPAYTKICDYLQDTYNSDSYSSHQYNKHNSSFDRWKIRRYTTFWTSPLNIFFVKLAQSSFFSSLNIGFLNCRRDIEIPCRVENPQNSLYKDSRTAINSAQQNEISALMDKFTEILSAIE